MRLWSIHPKYLDKKGLVALWREALLGQAVLAGKTKGYKNHPQLERFKAFECPLDYIGTYLEDVYEFAQDEMGYDFDGSKIIQSRWNEEKIPVTKEQLEYEFSHLQRKLETRDINKAIENGLRIVKDATRSEIYKIDPHPLFTVVDGPIAPWEKVK